MAGDAFCRNPFVGFECGGYRSLCGYEPEHMGGGTVKILSQIVLAVLGPVLF